MKTIKKYTYIADDGKIFSNKEECKKYEFELNLEKIKNVQFFDANGNLITGSRRHQGPAARLCRPADGPGPHRCRQLPQGVLRQGGRFHARRGARVVRDGQGRVWSRCC